MKKFIRLMSLAMLVVAFSAQTVFASEHMTMYGRTDSDAEYVSVLVLDSSITDLENITKDDIKYIDQGVVDDSGFFIITLPFFPSESYTVHSNLGHSIASDETQRVTYYVSSQSGSDTNDGLTAQTPLKSLSAAYAGIVVADEIILMDDTAYEEVPAHSGDFTIKGNTPSVKLTLPSSISLKGGLILDNLTVSGASTIYANGYNLKITETVTSADANRLTVYGGKNGAELTGDTNITLLGGKYSRVYGGGNSGKVTGNTNVVFGGNANPGDGINDEDSTTYSPCRVFGGGNQADVTGETNVTLSGNAVTSYVVGAGVKGGATATNINIIGGKVMNVYGGSLDTVLSGITTNITMTGGTAEALFGGSLSQPMTGHTNIRMLGGQVTRRIYSGCYNDWGTSGWGSSYYVTGSTSLIIGPDAQLVTKDGLDSENRKDMGIYAGSRVNKNNEAEINTLIFLDDCYNGKKGKIGMQDSFLENPSIIVNTFKNWADHTVTATAGGDIIAKSNGVIYVKPYNGYYGTIGSEEYSNQEFTLTLSTTTVTFSKKDFYIYDVTATKGESSATGTADINADNTTAQRKEPTLYVSVFEKDTNMLVDCAVEPATTGSTDFTLNGTFETGKAYIIKAMMWDGNMQPLTTVYSLELK